jgi:hypothetical protein
LKAAGQVFSARFSDRLFDLINLDTFTNAGSEGESSPSNNE